MNDAPFFSLLVPVFNAGKTITRCVASLTKQTGVFYEILLLDDGSKDDSLEKCRALQREYPEIIRSFHQENKGAVLTRRALLSQAKGEWLWMIDADDEIMPDSLSRLKSLSMDNRCDLILFDNLEQSADGSWTEVHQLPQKYDDRLFTGKEKLPLYRQAVLGNLNPLWNKVFHRSILDSDANYSQWADLKKGNDRLQMLPLLNNANRVLYRSLPLYRYYFSKGGLTETFGEHTLRATEAGISIVKEYAERWGGTDLFRKELALLRNRHIYQLLTQSLLSLGNHVRFADFQSYFQSVCSNPLFMEDAELLPLSEVDSYARQVISAVRERNAVKAYAAIRLRHTLHEMKKKLFR